MPATYGGDIVNSDLDWTRFTKGDTDTAHARLTDAEIQASILIYGTKQRAAKICMEAILVKLAQDCDYAIGPEKVFASQRYEQYKQFYETVKTSFSEGSITPQSPSTSSGIFNVGMMDSATEY
jgi:hypothetical protein